MLHNITRKSKVENIYFKKNDSVKVWAMLLPSFPPSLLHQLRVNYRVCKRTFKKPSLKLACLEQHCLHAPAVCLFSVAHLCSLTTSCSAADGHSDRRATGFLLPKPRQSSRRGVDLHKVSVFLDFLMILQRASPPWESWASLACLYHRHRAGREVTLLPEGGMDRSTEICLVWIVEGRSPRSRWLATPAREWKAVRLEEPIKGSLLPPDVTRPSCLQGRCEQPSSLVSDLVSHKTFYYNLLLYQMLHFIFFSSPPPFSFCYLKFVSFLTMGDGASNQHFPCLIASLRASPWTCQTQTHTSCLTCHKKNCSFKCVWERHKDIEYSRERG